MPVVQFEIIDSNTIHNAVRRNETQPFQQVSVDFGRDVPLKVIHY